MHSRITSRVAVLLEKQLGGVLAIALEEFFYYFFFQLTEDMTRQTNTTLFYVSESQLLCCFRPFSIFVEFRAMQYFTKVF